MSTVTAYFLIYNAVRKLQQYFPSYIVVINPWAENRSQNFLQNRNIPKENRERDTTIRTLLTSSGYPIR